MKEIPLNRGMVALVDNNDYEWLNGGNWYALRNGRNFYAVRNVKRGGGITTQYVHRFILNPPDGIEIDHKDCDGLNNQRANLRLCTHQENLRNQKPQTRGVSSFRGVSWFKGVGKWHAKIKVNGVTKHLGFFGKEIGAAMAYNRAALEFFGEFAKLNLIDRKEQG